MSQFADEIQSEMLAEKDDEITRLNAENAIMRAERDMAIAERNRMREALAAEKALTNACERVNRRNDELLDQVRALREALLDTTASLVASVSLLERGGKKAAPSDNMFSQMLVDYKNSIDRARAALEGVTEPANTQTGER